MEDFLLRHWKLSSFFTVTGWEPVVQSIFWIRYIQFFNISADIHASCKIKILWKLILMLQISYRKQAGNKVAIGLIQNNAILPLLCLTDVLNTWPNLCSFKNVIYFAKLSLTFFLKVNITQKAVEFLPCKAYLVSSSQLWLVNNTLFFANLITSSEAGFVLLQNIFSLLNFVLKCFGNVLFWLPKICPLPHHSAWSTYWK